LTRLADVHTGVDPKTFDRVLAALVGVLGAIEIFAAEQLEGPLIPNVLVVLAYGALLLWRRRHAFAMLLAFVTLVTVQTFVLTPVTDLTVIFGTLLLVGYACGCYLPRGPAVASLGLLLVAVVVVNQAQEDVPFGDYFFPSAFFVICWLAGRAIRARTLLTEELHEAAVRAREAHEEEARRATADERRRIAREMHDIVAHSISVMVIQAGGGRRILERDPARAVDAAALIEDTGRAALAEMRRLLGVLAAGEPDAVRAPQPTLANLEALVANAGLPAELHVEGERRALPPGVDLAAYRIVQEALTNVIKHGRAARTDVTVRWGEDAVELTIADRGPGPAERSGEDGGHGLVGMEERVRLYGGELHTGPRRGGGFEVRARLPFEREEIAA
jgi:signal transduction histidine kinase